MLAFLIGVLVVFKFGSCFQFSGRWFCNILFMKLLHLLDSLAISILFLCTFKKCPFVLLHFKQDGRRPFELAYHSCFNDSPVTPQWIICKYAIYTISKGFRV